MLILASLIGGAALAVAVAAGIAADTAASEPASEEDFVPSEELPADSAISFPVDI